MSIDSILRQKGAEVATIAPAASVRGRRAGCMQKNVGSSWWTSGNAVVGLIPNVKLFKQLLVLVRLLFRCL